jgi:hypothetical protein
MKAWLVTVPLVALAGTALADGWPQEMISRPLTLGDGMVDAHVSLGAAHAADTTSEGLTLGVGFGVNNKLDIGVDYGLGLNEFEAKGPLAARVGYRVLDGKLSAAGQGTFTYDLNSKAGDVGIGVAARFALAPQLAAYTPGNQLAIGVMRDDGGTGMSPAEPIVLRLPVGVAYQLSPNIYAFGETSIASISIANSKTQVIGSDAIPLIVGAFYSPSNTLDIGVALTDDLEHAGDGYAINAVLRVFKL